MTLFNAQFTNAEPVRTILTTTGATIVLAADSKNKQAVGKIHVCNVTASAVAVDIEVFDGTTSIYLEKGRSVAANAAFDIYDEILAMGQSLRATAATADALHVSVIHSLGRLGG